MNYQRRFWLKRLFTFVRPSTFRPLDRPFSTESNKVENVETIKDFEFDEAILDKWVAQSKPEGPDIESLEFIFDVIIKKMPPAVQLPFLGMKR